MLSLFKPTPPVAVQKKSQPQPEQPVKLPSIWDVIIYDDSGDRIKAKYTDARDIETDGWSISFDDSDGFGHEYFGFNYELIERV